MIGMGLVGGLPPMERPSIGAAPDAAVFLPWISNRRESTPLGSEMGIVHSCTLRGYGNVEAQVISDEHNLTYDHVLTDKMSTNMLHCDFTKSPHVGAGIDRDVGTPPL